MLSEQIDHLAYAQRVSKELGNTQRFNEKLHAARDLHENRINMQTMKTGNNFWNTGHTTASTFGLRTHSALQPKVKVTPYTRMNQTKGCIKAMEGFMSDGTALNMGDPNSMRDQGQTRNAVYNGKIKFNESKSMQRLPYKQFLRRDGPSNNTFYSFGGHKMIREETEREHLLNPIFRDYDGKVVDREVIVYRKDTNQRVQDYTKNISQSIFSPGELKNYSFVKKQQKLPQMSTKRQYATSGAQQQRGNQRRTNSAQPNSRRKLDQFATKLNEEAKRKERLRAQIEEIRSNMTVYSQALAANGY